MKKTYPSSLAFSTLASLFLIQSLSAAPPRLKLEPVVEKSFTSPVAITHAGDASNRLFVVDQRGLVQIIAADGMLVPEPFLDISDRLVAERTGFDERGLLSIAFHPDYQTNGKLYAYYSAPSENAPGSDEMPIDHQSVVAEFTVSADPNRVDASSERILLTVDQPQFNHDGGQLAFGPDGLLYISLGDGGGADDNDAGHTGGSSDKPDGGLGNSQDLSNLLGSILRIDPLGTSAPGGQYSIPENNPFAAQDDNRRDEIFAYGLRNPWRFSFDRETGELFCADVGQGEVEEVNIIESGQNYGWRKFEGDFEFDPTAQTTGDTFTAPIGQYAHPGSNIAGLINVGTSVTGGYVYRGSAIPALVGTYIFGDWTASFSDPSGTLLALEPQEGGEFILSLVDLESGNPLEAFVPTFGEDESGELYVATKTTLAPSAKDPVTNLPTGSVFRIVAAGGGVVTETVTLEPVADATLFEEDDKANGAGIYLFSGHTAGINDGLERRALLKFDIAGSIPAGATIEDATVSLRMNKIPRSGAVASNFGLHPLSKAWDEGTVDASGNEGRGATASDGGATWLSTSLNSGEDWEMPGGDFAAVPSAATRIASSRVRYDWNGEGIKADLQKWLDDDSINFGWMLLSDSDQDATARRFDSRHASNPANRPTLTVTYSIAGGTPSHREDWLAQFYPDEDFPGDDSDADGDLQNALIEYAFGSDPTTAGFQGELVKVDPSTDSTTLIFIRDPRAEDLTYTLQSSSNLTDWKSVASSSGGQPMAPEPESGVTIAESPIDGREPLIDVKATALNDVAVGYFRIQVLRNQ